MLFGGNWLNLHGKKGKKNTIGKNILYTLQKNKFNLNFFSFFLWGVVTPPVCVVDTATPGTTGFGVDVDIDKVCGCSAVAASGDAIEVGTCSTFL